MLYVPLEKRTNTVSLHNASLIHEALPFRMWGIVDASGESCPSMGICVQPTCSAAFCLTLSAISPSRTTCLLAGNTDIVFIIVIIFANDEYEMGRWMCRHVGCGDSCSCHLQRQNQAH